MVHYICILNNPLTLNVQRFDLTITLIFTFQFGGFSAESLSERTLDAKAKLLITADGVWRGDKIIHLKEISDKVSLNNVTVSIKNKFWNWTNLFETQALDKCEEQGHKIEHCVVVHHLPKLAMHSKLNDAEHESPNKRKQYDYKVKYFSNCWHIGQSVYTH